MAIAAQTMFSKKKDTEKLVYCDTVEEVIVSPFAMGAL